MNLWTLNVNSNSISIMNELELSACTPVGDPVHELEALRKRNFELEQQLESAAPPRPDTSAAAVRYAPFSWFLHSRVTCYAMICFMLLSTRL